MAIDDALLAWAREIRSAEYEPGAQKAGLDIQTLGSEDRPLIGVSYTTEIRVRTCEAVHVLPYGAAEWTEGAYVVEQDQLVPACSWYYLKSLTMPTLILTWATTGHPAMPTRLNEWYLYIPSSNRIEASSAEATEQRKDMHRLMALGLYRSHAYRFAKAAREGQAVYGLLLAHHLLRRYRDADTALQQLFVRVTDASAARLEGRFAVPGAPPAGSLAALRARFWFARMCLREPDSWQRPDMSVDTSALRRKFGGVRRR